MNVLIKQSCIAYDPDYATVDSVSYTTTLTADVPVTDAILIITDFVNNYLKHIVKRNNANYTEGALASVSTDGDTYSFAVKGEPKTTEIEFDFEV
jgi:hypothetical protein